MSILDTVEIVLRNKMSKQVFAQTHDFPLKVSHSVFFNVFDTPLANKWYNALQELLKDNYHLEKNYLWHGWADSERNGEFLCKEINKTFKAINDSDLDYNINDNFTIKNTINKLQTKGLT